MISFIQNNIKLIKEIFFYGIIGLTSAGIDSGVYYLLTRKLFFNEYAANFIGINIGITISFLLNTYFNFQKKNNLLKRATSFYLTGYAGLGLSMLLLYLGINIMHFNDFFIKIASIFIIAVFQFTLNKSITYGKIK